MIPKSRLQTDSINVQLLMQANKKRGAETMFIASAPRALQIRLSCKKMPHSAYFLFNVLEIGYSILLVIGQSGSQ